MISTKSIYLTKMVMKEWLKNVERWTEIIIFYISISVKKRHVFGAIFREFIFYPRDEVKQVY